MSIKILHTADNHIGMKFSNHSPLARTRLIQERINALQEIVNTANNEKVNYLVVAGDLFDSTIVKLADIKATAAILNGFLGDAVIIIPGNHDFYESAPETLWSKFSKYSNEGKVFLLNEYKLFEHEIGEQKVNFYPAACRSKHSDQNMIGWVKNIEKDTQTLNIGIAHGNVTGLGLDEGDKYFNMTADELKHSALDFWLLGHIHVPFPTTGTIGQNPGFFMSGTHTPDGWNRNQAGSCWLIEVGDDKSIKAELLNPSKIRFYDLEETINSEADLNRLKNKIQNLDAASSLLRLTVNGRISEDLLTQLNTLLQDSEDGYVEFLYTNLVKLNIDAAYINSNYTTGSLPHTLLTELAQDDGEGISLQLANDLIEKLKISQ